MLARVKIPAKHSTIQGLFDSSSPKSLCRLTFSSAGVSTLSRVVAKVNQNIKMEAIANTAMVARKPAASSSTPKYFTMGRTSMDISRPPPKAPTNRKVASMVLSLERGVMTPIRAE